MLGIIGEITGQERFRTYSDINWTGKDIIIQEAVHMRETRLVETLKAGESARSEGGTDERTRNRTKLEDGKIIIETYTEDGAIDENNPARLFAF